MVRNWRHKKHLNQLKSREAKETKHQQRNLTMEVLYYIFHLPVPIITVQTCCVSKRKENLPKCSQWPPKEENTISKENTYLKNGCTV